MNSKAAKLPPKQQRHYDVLQKFGLRPTENLKSNRSNGQLNFTADCLALDDIGANRALFCKQSNKKSKKNSSRLLVTFLEPGETPKTDKPLTIDDINRLDSWLSLRGKVPHFSSNDEDLYHDSRYKAVTSQQFNELKEKVKAVLDSQLDVSSAWIDSIRPKIGDLDRPIFVQKVVVENPDLARIYLVGDLHSSLDSLLNILQRMKRNNAFSTNFTLAANRYLVFLGDIVDRGPYSIELLALVFQLLISNPTKVFFINGNHEDCQTYSRYGLMKEVLQQFSISQNADRTINDREVLAFTGVLHYLPSAIVLQLGDNVFQLCHGAMTEKKQEQYQIRRLIDDKSGKRYAFLRNWLDNEVCFPDKMIEPDNLKWGDFDGDVVDMENSERDNYSGGMKVFGWRATQIYLAKLGLSAIISGHQDFSNFTMLIAPNKARGDDLLNVLVEPDENYTSLYRPRDYATLDLGAQFVIFEPGLDFLACNTSSSLASKGNEKGLLYDCFLTLFGVHKN